MDNQDATQANNRRLVRKLAFVTLAMFGFGFALVPLYDVFCEVTGLGGKTGQMDAKSVQATNVDTSRWITIQFTSSVNHGMPWEFRPAVTQMRVHPGELATTTYYARNLSGETITGQAVPSVSPNAAASYFKKIECFCFTKQELQAQEEKVMPVQYLVQPNLPADVHTITLSYTFFNTDKASVKKHGSGAQQHDAKAHPQVSGG